MKKILFVIICSFTIQTASSQTKEAAVKELIKVMKQDSLIDKTFSAILPSLRQRIQTQYGSDKSKASEELYNFTMQASAEMAKKIINQDMVTIYAKLFTEAEIADFITFYKSPSGKKMLTALPEIQKELMNTMMTKYMPEMAEKVQKKAIELKLDNTQTH